MNTELKVITYNIDGLPEKLDLNDLPWILKPISWIYKLIKKTTWVTINDNTDTSKNMEKIGKYFNNSCADIIAVQEDFNFHDVIKNQINGKYGYGKVSDKFELKGLFSKTEWWSRFPLPRFKSDGINMFYRYLTVKLIDEDIVSWKKSYGYIDHANDLLTHKGFRFYVINKDGIDIDVYVLHMDADFYNETKCPDVTNDIKARKSQLEQLIAYITKRYEKGNTNPIIVMGDTNSSVKLSWDNGNIDYFLHNINHIKNLEIKEAVPSNRNDVDRIFYINNETSIYHIDIKDCYFDMTAERMSDHRPLWAIFEIKKIN